MVVINYFFIPSINLNIEKYFHLQTLVSSLFFKYRKECLLVTCTILYNNKTAWPKVNNNFSQKPFLLEDSSNTVKLFYLWGCLPVWLQFSTLKENVCYWHALFCVTIKRTCLKLMTCQKQLLALTVLAKHNQSNYFVSWKYPDKVFNFRR